jgi:hypothetical protein
MSKIGTPKNLSEAIVNALNQFARSMGQCDNFDEKSVQTILIREHVRDYLGQKFGVFTDGPDGNFELWKQIFPEDRK